MTPRPRRIGRGRVAPRVDYGTLADLRYEIRRFLRVRETAARAAGLEPQQYLVLLQVKGLAERRPPTIGLLAERLQVRHHSAVELVDRLVERGLVARERASADRRQVMVTLRPAGEGVLRRLALLSLAELRQAGPRLVEVLTRLTGDRTRHRREGGAANPREDVDEGLPQRSLRSTRGAPGRSRGRLRQDAGHDGRDLAVAHRRRDARRQRTNR